MTNRITLFAAHRSLTTLGAVVTSVLLMSCATDVPISADGPDTLTMVSAPRATHTVHMSTVDGARILTGGGAMTSAYYWSTPTNHSLKRGIAEFAPPDFSGRLVKAVLTLYPALGGDSVPREPDTHVVMWYRSNGMVEVSDFDVSATAIDTVFVDRNDPAGLRARVDVTEAILANGVDGSGFRVQLLDDLQRSGQGSYGTTFGGNSGSEPPQLIITSVRERH